MEVFVRNIDLRGYHVYAAIRQGKTTITVEQPEVIYVGEQTTAPGSVVKFSLTQEQTGQFREGVADVQINWVDNLGNRNATKIKKAFIGENLIKEVI